MKISLGKDPEGTLTPHPDLAEAKRVVVLASGDPVRTLYPAVLRCRGRIRCGLLPVI